jgi:hypothetical protein
MSRVLEMLWDDVVAAVEDAAAGGDARAERLLAFLLEEEERAAREGRDPGVIARLAVRRYVEEPYER